MHEVFLLFQYPYCVIKLYWQSLSQLLSNLTCLACEISFFALELSSDNKDFLLFTLYS